MVRCAATAASWLLAANLALPFSHGVALEAAVATGRGLKEQEEVAEVIGDSKSDDPIWSLPEAIAKATGEEPITEWKEYLFKDGPLAFGEKEGVGSTAAIFPPRTLAENGGHMYQFNRNSGGGGVRGKKEWWPPITCPYGGAMQVEYYAQEQCIGVGQGLCKDGWQFGIRHYGDNTYLMLWREDNPAYPVVRWFPGATSLCIGEQYPNVAYLRITYDDCLYYLIGPGAGSAGSLARLKIAANTRKYKPDDVIVKFRDGPGDQNTLLQIFASGFSRTSPDAMWYPMPCETASPSSSPSSSPSGRPSSSPSASPTSSPTANPSASPSSSPSDAPSSAPSTLAVSIVPVPYFIKLIVFSRLPIRANQLYFCLFSYDRTVRCHLRSFHMSLRRPGNALRSMIFLPVALKYLAWELMTMRKLILEKSLPFTPSRYRGTASS